MCIHQAWANRFFGCEYLVTSPKVVETLHEQITMDINKTSLSFANIRNYMRIFMSLIVNICIPP